MITWCTLQLCSPEPWARVAANLMVGGRVFPRQHLARGSHYRCEGPVIYIFFFFLVGSEICASGNIWGTGLLGEEKSKGIWKRIVFIRVI